MATNTNTMKHSYKLSMRLISLHQCRLEEGSSAVLNNWGMSTVNCWVFSTELQNNMAFKSELTWTLEVVFILHAESRRALFLIMKCCWLSVANSLANLAPGYQFLVSLTQHLQLAWLVSPIRAGQRQPWVVRFGRCEARVEGVLQPGVKEL